MAEDAGTRLGFAYIGCMLWRNSRGRPLNAPAWSTVGLIVAVLIIIIIIVLAYYAMKQS